MKRRSFLRGTGLALGVLAVWPSVPSARAAQKPALTVSAAASMKDALGEINARYGEATVSLNLGASGALQRQIEQGAPVDVFVSAATKNMDELAAAELVDRATRRNVAANRLVLVVPLLRSKVNSFSDLNKATVKRFAMGAPDSVPAGKYAEEVLTSLKIYKTVSAKAVLGKDVREVLTQVELGNVDAGIVYATDARTSRQVRIAATAPTKLHLPILYPAAVVSDSKNKAAATAYVRFLSGPVAQKIFKKYGFQPAKG